MSSGSTSFRLSTPEKAIERVAQRVREGGHNVPEEVIRRRMEKGWRNFQEIYVSIVDEWVLYDGTANTPVVVERGSNPRLPGDQQMTVKGPKSDLRNRGTEEDPYSGRTWVDSFEAGGDQGQGAGAIATQGYVATWRNGKMYRDTKGIGVGKHSSGFVLKISARFASATHQTLTLNVSTRSRPDIRLSELQRAGKS